MSPYWSYVRDYTQFINCLSTVCSIVMIALFRPYWNHCNCWQFFNSRRYLIVCFYQHSNQIIRAAQWCYHCSLKCSICWDSIVVFKKKSINQLTVVDEKVLLFGCLQLVRLALLTRFFKTSTSFCKILSSSWCFFNGRLHWNLSITAQIIVADSYLCEN